MEKRYYQILNKYRSSYRGQENYYHNFEHARWVVEKGLEILKRSDFPQDLLPVYVHGMACHDAGHRCGLQVNDSENVKISLDIFSKIPNHLSDTHLQFARNIIQATCIPYEKTSYELACGFGYAQELIEHARDIDHLGIIGIEKESQRERALIGLFREFSQKTSQENLLRDYRAGTEKFFEEIHFYTNYGKRWAEKNLKRMKDWQLSFSKQAIYEACKNSSQ